jgi:hypothetical protein
MRVALEAFDHPKLIADALKRAFYIVVTELGGGPACSGNLTNNRISRIP